MKQLNKKSKVFISALLVVVFVISFAPNTITASAFGGQMEFDFDHQNELDSFACFICPNGIYLITTTRFVEWTGGRRPCPLFGHLTCMQREYRIKTVQTAICNLCNHGVPLSDIPPYTNWFCNTPT